MAFLSTAGIERLCSGVTNSRASERLDLGLHPRDRGGHGLLIVLVVDRQVVDLDEFGLEFVAAEVGERLRQLAIDGFAPI